MKYAICAVRDAAVDGFMRPIFVQSTRHAVRVFADEVNRADGDNTMRNHPHDFELFHLGFYDDAHATFEVLDNPESLATGKSVLQGV